MKDLCCDFHLQVMMDGMGESLLVYWATVTTKDPPQPLSLALADYTTDAAGAALTVSTQCHLLKGTMNAAAVEVTGVRWGNAWPRAVGQSWSKSNPVKRCLGLVQTLTTCIACMSV